VWTENIQEELEIDEDDNQADRLFTFEVTKTKEQEEDVISRPGILVRELLSTLVAAKAEVGRLINAVPRV